MKKLLAILMTLILCLGFTACGDKETEETKKTESGKSSENASEKDKVEESVVYSQGLEFKFHDVLSCYAVSGIGTCTDEHIVIPTEHNDYPVNKFGRKLLKIVKQ